VCYCSPSLYSPLLLCSRNKELVGARVATAGLVAAVYGEAPQPALGPSYVSAVAGAAADGSSLWANVTLTLAPAANGSAPAELEYVPPHVDTWQNSSRCPTEIGVAASFCGWFVILGSDGRNYNASLAALPEPGSLVLPLVAAVVPPVPGIQVRRRRSRRRRGRLRAGKVGSRKTESYSTLAPPPPPSTAHGDFVGLERVAGS